MPYTFEQFEAMLKNHDWTYGYSDDGSVWKKGEAEWQEIQKADKELRLINEDRVEALYKQYDPFVQEVKKMADAAKNEVPAQDLAYQILEARIIRLEEQLNTMPEKVLAVIDANADVLWQRGAYLTTVRVGQAMVKIVKAPFKALGKMLEEPAAQPAATTQTT